MTDVHEVVVYMTNAIEREPTPWVTLSANWNSVD